MELRRSILKCYTIVFLLPTCLWAQHPFFKQYSRTDGLPGNSIYYLVTDASGKVWIATNHGIAYYSNNKFIKPDQPKALKSANVMGISQEKSNTIWLNTSGGQFFKGNENGFVVYNIPQKLNEIAENRIINSFCIDKQGALYAGTVIGGGMYRLMNESLNAYHPNESKNSSYFLTEIETNRFVWGSRGSFPPDNVLHVTLQNDQEFTVTLSSKSGFSKSSFLELNDGSFLFAKDYEIIHFKAGEVIQRAFLHQKIETLFESSDEKLWVGLNKGGVICFLTDNLTTNISSRYLSTNTITSITEDFEGNTWLASLDNGLFMLPGKPEMNYSAPKIFTANSLEKKPGKVNPVNDSITNRQVSPTDSVQMVITPVLNDSIPPDVYISGISINNRDTSLSDIYHLRYDENFISINFTGLVNNHPHNLQYRYFLKGFDTAWVYTNTPNVQYSRLIPGEYVFTVFAMDNKGIWSPTPAKVTFFVTQPFWNTWLFYAALIIAFLLFAVLALFWGLKRSRERAKMNKQSLLNELKVLRAQMNPHFTFNTLSSIQHFIGNNNNDAAINYLSKFAKLMRSIMENTKKPAIPIKDEISALRLYIDLERLRLNSKFDYQIEIDTEIDEQYDQIPSLLIQPYVENAIWHGFTNKNEKGMINIRLKRNNNFIICEIEDNGIGREASKKLNGSRSKHTSMGMEITKERLEIINALNNSPLSVNITDLKNEDGQTGGTKVEIFIPLEE